MLFSDGWDAGVMPKSIAPVVPRGTMGERGQPVLRVEGLTLRPWVSGDAPAVVGAYADPLVYRWHKRSMTLSEAAEWIAAANDDWIAEAAASWAVVEDDLLVGRMSLRAVDLEDGVADLGYWVTATARGRAIAPRALGAVSDWAFNELGLHRIELEHSTQNQASCRVADKAGYVLEGTKRCQSLHDDGWHDVHLHVRLAEEGDQRPSSGS